MVTVGTTLQPDAEFLRLLGEFFREDCEHFEVAPETTWRVGRSGALEPNGFHREFAELKASTGRPFIAHGVGFSVGGSGAPKPSGVRRGSAR